MSAWWTGLTEIGRISFIIASVGTLLMIVQLILLIFGIGHDGADGLDSVDGGADGVADGHDVSWQSIGGLKIFTIRGVIVFCAIGGWAMLASSKLVWWGSLLIGIGVGLAAAVLVAVAFKAASRLENEGNIKLENAVGKIATVYLTIPPESKGTGKVNLLVQERFVELEAVCKNAEGFKTGESVMVVGVTEFGDLIVDKPDVKIEKEELKPKKKTVSKKTVKNKTEKKTVKKDNK